MKATFLFALFLFVAAAANGCQDKEMPPASPKEPALRDQPSTHPAEPATQPGVAEVPRRVLWWGDPKPTAEGEGSATAQESPAGSERDATVSAPTGEQ
jgi:hypothetical protein